MAFDFDALVSKAQHNTADLWNGGVIQSVACWALADGQGESNSGVILSTNEAGNNLRLRHDSSDNRLEVFVPGWSTSDPNWEFPATDGVWNAVAFSYDGSSTSNDPSVRVNFASVSTTETVAPTGTFSTPTTGYCIGNITAQTQTWDGAIAYLQVWDRILTAAEMDTALRHPGSIRSGLRLFLPMLDIDRAWDISGLGWNPTLTTVANRAGPPVRAVWMTDDDDEAGAIIALDLMPQIAM